MSAPVLTEAEVRKQLERAREEFDEVDDAQLERLGGGIFDTATLRRGGAAALAALERKAGKLAGGGTAAVGRVFSIVGAYGYDHPGVRPGASRGQALDRIEGAGDRLQDREDAEREAVAAALDVAKEVGLAVVRVLGPALLAAAHGAF